MGFRQGQADRAGQLSPAIHPFIELVQGMDEPESKILGDFSGNPFSVSRGILGESDDLPGEPLKGTSDIGLIFQYIAILGVWQGPHRPTHFPEGGHLWVAERRR